MLLPLLAGCESAIFNPVTPDLQDYSDKFMDLAAEQLESEPAPCDRLDPQTGCSALTRLVLDYQLMRDQTRAIND